MEVKCHIEAEAHPTDIITLVVLDSNCRLTYM